MLKAASLLALGVLVGAFAAFPSGWQAHAALDTPSTSSVRGSAGAYTATMRRDLTSEIRWLNYAAKHRSTAR